MQAGLPINALKRKNAPGQNFVRGQIPRFRMGPSIPDVARRPPAMSPLVT